MEEVHDLMKNPFTAETSGKCQELYNRWAANYDEELESVRYRGPSMLSEELSKHCPDKSISILDCGSGTGLVGQELSSHGFLNITGMDISQESLDISAKRGVYKKLVRGASCKEGMPFEDNEFDALVACSCVAPGHVSPEFFPEWVRIVKPGGIIIISIRQCFLDDNGDYPKEFKETFYEELGKLEKSRKWELILKDLRDFWIGNPTFLYVMKVLQI